MDDLGVPLFLETPPWLIHVYQPTGAYIFPEIKALESWLEDDFSLLSFWDVMFFRCKLAVSFREGFIWTVPER